MEEEIKEILDKLQRVANRETASRNALMEMKDTDYQLLLDYITNLQEENKKLKKLQEENDRFCDETMKDMKEKLIARIDRQDKKIEILEERITQAIEYIKNNCYIETTNEYMKYGDDLSPKHLVDILQGSDKE